MENKGEWKVGLRIGRIEADALFEIFGGLFVLLHLTVRVCEISEYGLENPETDFAVAEWESLGIVLFCLAVVLLFVADDTQFGVDKWVVGIDFRGFVEGKCGGFEIVGSEVLHSHVKVCLGATWEEPHNCPVNWHRLIGLVLHCEGVSHTDPSVEEASIEHDGFLEVLPGDFVLFTMEIVCSDGKPADGMRGIVLDEIVRAVVKLSCQS